MLLPTLHQLKSLANKVTSNLHRVTNPISFSQSSRDEIIQFFSPSGQSTPDERQYFHLIYDHLSEMGEAFSNEVIEVTALMHNQWQREHPEYMSINKAKENLIKRKKLIAANQLDHQPPRFFEELAVSEKIVALYNKNYYQKNKDAIKKRSYDRALLEQMAENNDR